MHNVSLDVMEHQPANSNGDWPFLRPAERVPEVPVVSLEHLLQLEELLEFAGNRVAFGFAFCFSLRVVF